MNANKRTLTMLTTLLTVGLPLGCQDHQSANSFDRARQHRLTDASDQLPPFNEEIEPDTHVAAGRLHESYHRYARAAQQYRQAIDLNPENLEAYNRLGVVYDKLGRFQEADEAFLTAIQIAPDKAFLYNNLGFSYALQQRYGEAEEVLHRAIQIQPDFARARVNLGMCLAHQDRWQEALAQFEQAVPREAAYYNIGLLYHAKKRYNEAAHAYRTALTLNPEMRAAEKRLAMLSPDAQAQATPFSITATPQPETQYAATPVQRHEVAVQPIRPEPKVVRVEAQAAPQQRVVRHEAQAAPQRRVVRPAQVTPTPQPARSSQGWITSQSKSPQVTQATSTQPARTETPAPVQVQTEPTPAPTVNQGTAWREVPVKENVDETGTTQEEAGASTTSSTETITEEAPSETRDVDTGGWITYDDESELAAYDFMTEARKIFDPLKVGLNSVLAYLNFDSESWRAYSYVHSNEYVSND